MAENIGKVISISGPADGPTLVLVHGWGCDRTDFDAVTYWTLQNLGVGNLAMIVSPLGPKPCICFILP